MRQIALVGSGKIGEAICKFLSKTDDYSVTVVDISAERLDSLSDSSQIEAHCLDVTDEQALTKILSDHFAVISAGPYYLNMPVSRAAKRTGTHYLDLTEDISSARSLQELGQGATTAFIPQCGLAPGFISIVARDLADRFDELDTVSLRVGALPEYPTNSLGYNLTWSTEGLFNEYTGSCIAIVNGEQKEVPPLEQREEFSLDGITYESFNTSGGLGTLDDTLRGKVRNLSYQTIRYPGHCEIMKTLLRDLRLAERREVLIDILEHAIPTTLQDVVLIFVTVRGLKEKRLIQETYANKIYSRTIEGHEFSAIQLTTAGSVCAMLDLLSEGKTPDKGFVRQEQVHLDDFLANRFGKYFRRQGKRDFVD